MSKPELERRMNRMIDLVVLLRRHPGEYDRLALAERYQVSERMIQKDLRIIKTILPLERRKNKYRFIYDPFGEYLYDDPD